MAIPATEGAVSGLAPEIVSRAHRRRSSSSPGPAHALDDRGTVRDQGRGDDSGTEPRVQRREFWPFGQHSCQFLSARPQLSVFEDMSVFLPLSPALVMGFRRFPVAVLLQRRWRSGSLRLSSHPRGMKAWVRPSVGTLEAAGGEGGQTVPGRIGDDAVVCCCPTMDLEPAVCRRRAIRAVAASLWSSHGSDAACALGRAAL